MDEIEQARAKGYNVNTADVIHRMSAEGTWEGPLDYNQIIRNFGHEVGIWEKQSSMFMHAKSSDSNITAK